MNPNKVAGRFEMKDKILLADIGNTYFHVFNGEAVEHLSYEEAIAKYQDKPLCYISVKHQLEDKIMKIKFWKNISQDIVLPNAYATMGVDRRALCLNHSDGVFVDAGSAITVDVMEHGIYRGGYIFPGLKAMQESYKTISPALDMPLNKMISLDELPLTTKDGISYGIIASIKALIDKHRDGKRLYITGGDGVFLSPFFEDAIYDEMLVFNGIRQALKDKDIC